MFDVLLADDIGRGLRASNPQTTDSVLTRLDGWVGGVSVKLDRTDRLGDGVVLEPMRREGREITVAGAVTLDTPAEAWALERYISGLFTGRGLGAITVTQDGAALTAAVQLDGTVKLATRIYPDPAVEWEIPVYAPDPRLYGAARTMQLRPVDTGAGFVWPGFADGFADWGVSGGDEAQLTNAGNAAALPTVTVTVDDGSGFRLSSGARSVEWVGACSRSVPVVVDMAGRVLVGGVDRSAQLVRREWLSVPPRGVVSMSLSTLSGGGGSAIATVRDTWI